MRAFTPIAALVSLAAFAAAIRNPDNPQDPINCPPSGGADKCSKETSVSGFCGSFRDFNGAPGYANSSFFQCNNRIRINYGQTEKGHYIWYLCVHIPSLACSQAHWPRRNDYDPNNLPQGITITTDTVGTC